MGIIKINNGKTREEVTSWKWKLDSEENDVIAC